MTITTDKTRDNRLRRAAARCDLRLIKSRSRNPDALDFGLYGLIMNSCNGTINPATVDGRTCSWSLDDVEQYLNEQDLEKISSALSAGMSKMMGGAV